MKYKALNTGPKIKWFKDFEYTDKERFLMEDEQIPLLVCNYQIYPDEFKDLSQFKGRTIALIGIAYLSGRETEVKEYFLDERTIITLLSQRTLITNGQLAI